MTWDITTQLTGLLVSTGLTIILIFALYYFVIRKQKAGEAPTNKLMVFLELYYEGFNKLVNSLSGGKNAWANLYLFVLFNFIFINSLMPWLGLEAAPSTLMFTLPIAILSFIGIYIIGIGTMGFVHFCKHKYANPMEIVMQFAPLISMSVRLFGATFAGAVIGNVPWIIVNAIAGGDPAGVASITSPIWQAIAMFAWKVADTALSLIQAFVFMTLTIIFWCMDTGESWSPAERKALKEKHKLEKLEHETTAEVKIFTIEEELDLTDPKTLIKEIPQVKMEEVQNE